jgi:hypothetical protein
MPWLLQDGGIDAAAGGGHDRIAPFGELLRKLNDMVSAPPISSDMVSIRIFFRGHGFPPLAN